jgi:hypothetical protein
MIILLKTNNFSLSLNREYLKSVLQKNILMKTTYVLVFVGKHLIKQELTLE